MQTAEADQLKPLIAQWSNDLGFDVPGYSDTGIDCSHFINWLDRGYQGEMDYMRRHAHLRCNPADLHPGTVSIISVRMNYLPTTAREPWSVINDPAMAYVSRYATGRDYHKLMRKRLQQLAIKISEHAGPFGYRAFVDSAPVLEKPLARAAGLGWIGKHTNVLNRSAGSWFFLGELYTDLPLSANTNHPTNHCGRCQACIDICPTDAIVAPYQLDARRCISYLTIELRGSIPVEYRTLIGNRIYGCDDCQLVCPWNKFARYTSEDAFEPRHELDHVSLLQLFSWTEQQFLDKLQGSAIRRIGHECWQRNIAVAMGNADFDKNIIAALSARRLECSPMVAEHIDWALQQQHGKAA